MPWRERKISRPTRRNQGKKNSFAPPITIFFSQIFVLRDFGSVKYPVCMAAYKRTNSWRLGSLKRCTSVTISRQSAFKHWNEAPMFERSNLIARMFEWNIHAAGSNIRVFKHRSGRYLKGYC